MINCRSGFSREGALPVKAGPTTGQKCIDSDPVPANEFGRWPMRKNLWPERGLCGVDYGASLPHTWGPVMLKIWGRKNSSNVRKALWIAEEIGIAYQSLDAGGAFGLVEGAEYRAKNPNGRIPMIEDGDFILWESNAIVRYLAARYAPDSAFYPADVQARASADKWMDWTTSTLADPFKPVFWGGLRTPPEQQDWALINAGIKTIHELLRVPDKVLSKQPYLSGDELGMGDIPLGSFIYAWFEMPIERPPLPGLEAWYERLKARAAYQKAVMTVLS